MRRSFFIVLLAALIAAGTAQARNDGLHVCVPQRGVKSTCKVPWGPPPLNAPGTTTPVYTVYTVQAGRAANNVFLCWSQDQTNPGVWDETDALALTGQGYFPPAAIHGNVAGGTNLGSYHLSCAGPFASTALYLGDDGGVYGPDVAGTNLGYYPVTG